METLRAFVAIELEEDILRELARVQTTLKEKIPEGRVRWTRPDGVHLTLKFLGYVPQAKVEEIVVAMQKAREAIKPFTLTIGGLGCFPSTTNPRVIWVGVEGDDMLRQLYANLEEETASLGFPREKNPFNPHLTLGRVRENASYSARLAMGGIIATTKVGELGRMQVTRISLIKSVLLPGGAEYSPLNQIPLAG